MTAIPFPNLEEFRKRLVYYFQRNGCGNSSEDLAQETLKRQWQKYSEAADDEKLRPEFAFGIAKNVIQEWRRDRNRVRQIDPDWPEPVEPHVGTLAQLIKVEDMRRFQACFSRLKTQDRQLLEEYYNGSPEQRQALAAGLEISRGALSGRIWYITEKLRECMKIIPLPSARGTI
jgi:RNA polymerase sigma factor (sigma-70 family)